MDMIAESKIVSRWTAFTVIVSIFLVCSTIIAYQVIDRVYSKPTAEKNGRK